MPKIPGKYPAPQSTAINAFSTTSLSFVDASSGLVIKASGAPVKINLKKGSTISTAALFYVLGVAGTDVLQADIAILRDSTVIWAERLNVQSEAPTGPTQPFGAIYGSIYIEDTPPPGTYTYKVQARLVTGVVCAITEAVFRVS